MSRALRFAPLIVLAIIVLAMIWRLATPTDTNVASKLEGKAIPSFALPAALPTKPALSAHDLAGGQPRLLNIFASWCVPCISEVKVLQALQQRGVTVEGIAVRDTPEALSRFLSRYGDPYARIGSDRQSAVQIALGSSGVPESFIVDGKGVIRYQHIGPIETGGRADDNEQAGAGPVKRAMFLAIALAAALPVYADSNLPPAYWSNRQLPDARQEAQAQALMAELRCLVCQGQSIADSDAELAGDMRDLVRRRIAAGERPATIRSWLIERYGTWISYRPTAEAAAWPLWAAPLLLLILGAWIIGRRVRLKRAL